MTAALLALLFSWWNALRFDAVEAAQQAASPPPPSAPIEEPRLPAKAPNDRLYVGF